MKSLAILIRFWAMRLFYLLYFLIFLFGSYFFRVPKVSFGSFSLSNPFYTKTIGLSPWLYSVDYLIFVFICTFILVLILIVIYIDHKRKKNQIHDLNYDILTNDLFSYLYEQDEYRYEEKREWLNRLKERLEDDALKRQFLNRLRRVHLQTQGLVHEKTAKLLKILQYDYLIRVYLHSPFLRNKLFALKIISDFQLEGYDSYIVKLANRKNNVLHAEALVTLIKLHLYDNMLFLIDFNIQLTVWDINVIIRTVQQVEYHNIDYYELIKSRTPEISVLGIMLARIDKRCELKFEIKQQIGHPNKLLNEEAFLTYISFADEQSDFDFLMYKFEIASEKGQHRIIQALIAYQNKTEKIKFLNWVIENKPIILKIEAIRLMLELDLNYITTYKSSKNKLIRQSCLQVLDYNM
jgi:hypothetical protein